MNDNQERSSEHLDHWRDVPWDQRFECWAYPIAIVQDRYGGAYSSGEWIAIAQVQNPETGGTVLRLLHLEPDREPSPWGGDVDALNYWGNPPKWVGVGQTPEEALAALKRKNADVTWPFEDNQ